MHKMHMRGRNILHLYKNKGKRSNDHIYSTRGVGWADKRNRRLKKKKVWFLFKT